MKNSNQLSHLYIALESIYYLHRVGDHLSAKTLTEEIQDEIDKSPKHKALAQLITLIGKYEQNTFNNKDYDLLSNHLKKSIEESEIAFYLGWLHFLTGYYKKNSKELTQAAMLFIESSSLNELFEVYYWMNNFKVLPNDEKFSIFLRTYPIKSIYSKIMGNSYYQNELRALTQIQKDQEENWPIEEETFDCWLISGDTITPASYKSLDLEDTSFLDIYSGLINDRGEFAFLLISEINCLSFLIAAQLTGANLVNISDFLGRTAGETEEIINNIIRLGIKIKKENGLYFLNWEAKPLMIIPRSLKVKGLQEYLKKKTPAFSKNQLIDILQLSQHGADSLIKKWETGGIIKALKKSEADTMWILL
ncbi:MAG: hypothetical protein Q7U04_12770 [Bacteriovorax sp.]|nr:hypothetical protein [Bacteriovorax sp.]